MFKVKSVFRDKITKKVYAIGDAFVSADASRLADLSARGLIEKVEDASEKPAEKPAGKKSKKSK